MSWKTSAAIVATTITLATGALAYTTPRNANDLHQIVQDQQINDLSDSQDNVTENHRARGIDHLHAENDTRNGQHSPRPLHPPQPPRRPPTRARLP